MRSYVAQLHALVDNLTAPLSEGLGDRLQCKLGCSSCCSDGLTVFEVEGDRLAQALQGRTITTGPVGGCVFLDPQAACQVYESRPYVCRTQGLPLRWGAESADGPVEHRDICPLNEGEPPLEELPAEACWTLGPVEQRLAIAQRQAQKARGDTDEEPLRRVGLRELVSALGVG